MTRKNLIARVEKIGASLAANAAKGNEITWQLGEACIALRATYPQGKDNVKAFLATAATASGKGESMIGNLVRAVEVRESLTTAQKDAVAGWSYDAVLTLAGEKMTPAKRTTLIGKADKAGTQNVKVLRTFKSQLVGKNTRERGSQKDRTIALVKSLQKDLDRLMGKHDVLALIAGAQFAQDNPGKDVAAAIVFAHAQVSKATVSK